METNPALLQIREETAASLRRSLGVCRDVALLDFPSYMNVGDSMIWAGQKAYLDSLEVNIRYSCDIERYSSRALRGSHPTGAILLQGGGNLGDIWPSFQVFREQVVQEFPDRKIIQLPQTLFYGSPSNARRTNRIFGEHPDLTIMLRDSSSLQRASQLLPSVKTLFVRDMALGWTPPAAARSDGTRGILILARKDTEATGSTADLKHTIGHLGRVEVADWGLEGPSYARWRLAKIPGRIVRHFNVLKSSRAVTEILSSHYEQMLRLNLDAGVRMFENRSLIITDRLHAHVLAGLMGIPHIVMDNSYGKIRSIYDDYTHMFSEAHFATSNEHAVKLAARLTNEVKQA